MGRLDLAIDPLLLDRQPIEVQLGGRGQGLDDVLDRILVNPIPEVEQQHRDLGVGEESREKVPRGQVLADRVVVGEVAVMDQRLVESHERVRPARVPHAAFGRIALMGDPDMGLHVGHPIVLDGRFGKADDLEHHQIARVGDHERPLLAQGRIELVV